MEEKRDFAIRFGVAHRFSFFDLSLIGYRVCAVSKSARIGTITTASRRKCPSNGFSTKLLLGFSRRSVGALCRSVGALLGLIGTDLRGSDGELAALVRAA